MRPLGYLLIHLHQLLEFGKNAILAPVGLTRRHWQVLNAIANSLSTHKDIDEALAPFLLQDGQQATSLIDELATRGWVREDGTLSLTATGQEAHTDVKAKILAFQEPAMQGINQDDLATTVRVLTRMAENLRKRQSNTT